MNEVIIYILKVIAIHGLFYLFYRLVLRNTGRHTFNRGYLLVALVAAFLIPFIEIAIPEKSSAVNDVIEMMWLAEPHAGLQEFEIVPVKQENASSYWHLVPWIYGTIALILFARSIFYLSMLTRLKRHSEYIKKHWFKLFKISQDRPFSFFSNIFMPKSLFGTEAFDQILAHECEHVRQLHSVDRLLVDFVVSLFWFNPFIYLYRNGLIEIHEFQADEVVLNRFQDPVGYQEILFSQLQSAQYSGLVSHFNFSMTKKRIVMMNKQRKMSGWIYALTAPVTLMVIFAFSSKEAMEPLNEVGDEIAAIIGPENGIDWPELRLEPKGFQENRPSIMPLRVTDLTRMSSGFGMRKHPISKERKMHKGMDFACPMGTEIFATGDGKVTSVKTFEGGYGKLITIAHGDTYKTRYAQLSEFKVKEGDIVKKGDVIGLAGSSGASTAPHLHYEVLENGKHVDPADFIKDYDFKAKLEPQDEAEEHRLLAEEEMQLARQEMELAREEQALAMKEEKLAQEELIRAEREMRLTELERERLREREKALQELEEERVEEERELIRLRILEEKLKFEDSQQNPSIRFSGDLKPLYVIDGEIVEDVSDLDPSEIEQINVLKGKVLKGKRAQSLYGNKGENGVIEITTKGKNKNKQKDKLKDKPKKKVKNKSKNKDKEKKEVAKAVVDAFGREDLISLNMKFSYK